MDTARVNPKPQYTLRTGYSEVVVCPHVAFAAGKLPPIYNANLPPPLRVLGGHLHLHADIMGQTKSDRSIRI